MAATEAEGTATTTTTSRRATLALLVVAVLVGATGTIATFTASAERSQRGTASAATRGRPDHRRHARAVDGLGTGAVPTELAKRSRTASGATDEVDGSVPAADPTAVATAPPATTIAGLPPATDAASLPLPTPVPPAAPTIPAPPEAPPSAVDDLPDDPDQACAVMVAVTGVSPPAGWSLRCAPPRIGLVGEANPVRREIVVYVRRSWTATEGARTLAHELGHAFDWALLTDADRTAWMQARGFGGDWGHFCPYGTICGDTDRPAGDWAEAVGELLVPGTDMWCSQLGAPPTVEQLALVRDILAAHGVAA